MSDTVWAVYDLEYAPGPCWVVHIASTEQRAQAWVAAHRQDLSYGEEIVEWQVDDG